MLIALLVAQVASAPAKPSGDTATYSSDAVHALVSEASRLNSAVPASLGRYRASVESEISYGNRTGEREMSVGIEQVASALTWARTGAFEQHVVGFRSQSIGPGFSTLGFFTNAWAVPALYGNRLSLLFGTDTARRNRAARSASRSSTPYVAVHPLSVDRERYYRFSGGDTVQNLIVDGREIRIVRIIVEPKAQLPAGTFFSGEVNLDISRKHVVRMRGSFLSTRGLSAGPLGLFRLAQLEGIAFVELVNAEVNQEYWLPSYQRFEAHAVAPTLSDSRAVFRIVSRFRDYTIDPPASVVGVSAADTLRSQRHHLTLASADSMARFGDWHDDIGQASASLAATDFDSVAPPKWRPFGRPVVMFQSERMQDLVRFNRVEGLYTGLSVSARMRDAAPGVTARATAGYAWSEATVRGRASVEWARGAWTHALRAGRSLDITNDFRNPFDSGSTTGALFGVDNYDYVDRAFAGVATTRRIGRDDWLARVEAGWARDGRVDNHVTDSPFGGPEYLVNRGADGGDYLRTAFSLRWHPTASAESIRPGVGASVDYVRGDGGLDFQRVELSVNARTNAGRWTFASRFDAGAVFGDVPPQQLFELGSRPTLPGYEYKEFAGDRAAAVRAIGMFRLNVLTAPIHLVGRLWLPEPSPALAVTVQAGWTGASSDAARAAILRLGSRYPVDPTSLALQAPASRVTGDPRATVSAGIRFFGGTVGLMLARPVDHSAPWKFQVEFGQLF